VNFAANKNKIVELFDPAVVKGATPDSRYGLSSSGGYTRI